MDNWDQTLGEKKNNCIQLVAHTVGLDSASFPKMPKGRHRTGASLGKEGKEHAPADCQYQFGLVILSL